MVLSRFYVSVLLCLLHNVEIRAASLGGSDSREYTVLAVGTVGQYYIDGIFKYLNASKTPDLTLTVEQLSVLMKKLELESEIENITGNSTQCISAKGLVGLFDMKKDEVDIDSFLSYCPALIYEQIFHECIYHTKEHILSYTKWTLTDAETYGYGTAAVAVITAIPLILFFLIPQQESKKYPYVVNTLMSLAVSTLVTDSLLHLIPQALGTYDLALRGDDLPVISSNLWKIVGVIGAIYAMYLFTMLMAIRERLKAKGEMKGRHSHGHRHSHQPRDSHEMENRAKIADKGHPLHHLHNQEENPQHHHHHHHQERPHFMRRSSTFEWAIHLEEEDSDANSDSEQSNTSAADVKFSGISPVIEEAENNDEGEEDAEEDEVKNEGKTQDSSQNKTQDGNTIQRVKSAASLKAYDVQEKVRSFRKECTPKKHYGWVILLSDLIHNVMDGAAIGAAFMNNPISGLATSIAVAFHEIPHEIGDFAALMASGVSWRGAFIWNAVLSILSFVGLYVGISVAQNSEAASWVYALSAGVFLHHALSEFLPDLMEIEENFWAFLALQHVGLFIGFAVILVLQIFQDTLYKAFPH